MSARLEDLRDLVAEALRHTRHLAFELRPTVLDDVGLAPALVRLAAELSARSGLDIGAAVDGGREFELLTPEAVTAIYRIAQEALTNVIRHARATTASVTVTAGSGRVRVLVEDDGVGFDPTSTSGDHLGLRGMKERADLVDGTLCISSARGAGTAVVLELPLG